MNVAVAWKGGAKRLKTLLKATMSIVGSAPRADRIINVGPFGERPLQDVTLCVVDHRLERSSYAMVKVSPHQGFRRVHPAFPEGAGNDKVKLRVRGCGLKNGIWAGSRTGTLYALAIPALVVLFSLPAAGLSFAREYQVSKKAGEYRVDVAIDRNPPIVADNHVTIKIRDGGGSYVTDARVSVNYWMPPMPGMPPMNYTTQALLKGSEYRATMKLIMAGPWNIVITLNRGGKAASMKFPIDVR